MKLILIIQQAEGAILSLETIIMSNIHTIKQSSLMGETRDTHHIILHL